MSDTTDALRPSADQALQAWAARVRANREQVEQFREATQADFYAPIASLFRSDPRRTDEPTLEALRGLVRADDSVLDIGAGGGRYAMPLALASREVVAVEPSDAMLGVLREGMAEHGIDNIQVVQGRWPSVSGVSADVALISHLGYDIEDIGPFLNAMEAAARRLCIAVLLERPPPAEADRLWPFIHGVKRAALPALPEFLTLLLARGKLFELRLVERAPQSYATPDQLMAWLRTQLWTRPGSPKDAQLEELLSEAESREGHVALSWQPVRVGIVTWSQ